MVLQELGQSACRQRSQQLSVCYFGQQSHFRQWELLVKPFSVSGCNVTRTVL